MREGVSKSFFFLDILFHNILYNYGDEIIKYVERINYKIDLKFILMPRLFILTKKLINVLISKYNLRGIFTPNEKVINFFFKNLKGKYNLTKLIFPSQLSLNTIWLLENEMAYLFSKMNVKTLSITRQNLKKNERENYATVLSHLANTQHIMYNRMYLHTVINNAVI